MTHSKGLHLIPGAGPNRGAEGLAHTSAASVLTDESQSGHHLAACVIFAGLTLRAKDSSASASASALLAPAAASMAATSASKPASGANLAARAAVLFVRGTSSAPDLKCRVGASLFACKEACLAVRIFR